MKNLLLNELYLELANHLKWMPSQTRKLILISINSKGIIIITPQKGITPQGILIDEEPIINFFISKKYLQIANYKEEDPAKYQWKLSFKRDDN